MSRALAWWTAAWLSTAQAQTAEDERARVQERIEEERQALEGLKDQRAETLDVLDALERIARDSTSRLRTLEGQARTLAARVEAAEGQEAQTRAALTERLDALSPRLRALYRLTRQDKLGFLLSAEGFAQAVKRGRALATLVESEGVALGQAQRLARYQLRQARRLSSLRRSAELRLASVKQEAALSGLRRAAFQDLLEELQAEAARSSRLVKDLERAEGELSRVIASLAEDENATGFRARRGRMPYPTRGLLEMGFGRMVNPRFKTVTTHKGIDLRARAGSPVVSVGEGTVAFAGWLKGYGNLVIIDHGSGYHSLAAHLETMSVEPGNEVEEGEEIGTVGDTGSLKGAYLYFEIRQAGEAIDPLPWLDPSATP